MPPIPLFDGRNCTECLLWKPFSDFHKDKRSPGGRRTICKSCVKAYQQRLRANPSPRKPASRDEKRCPRCGLVKPALEFKTRVRDGRTYLRSYCHPCDAEHLVGLPKNPEKARAHNRRMTLRRYYGMSVEDYDALLIAQKGVCAVCGSPEPSGRKKYLCVDHDHVTGAIRGLLCGRCNVAVGFLRDDPDRAVRLIEYLRTHSERPPETLVHFATPLARR